MDTQKEIGRRIREARLERGLSAERLAQAGGVSVGTISRWERGISFPEQLKLIRVAEALELSPHYLITGQPGSAAPKDDGAELGDVTKSVQEMREELAELREMLAAALRQQHRRVN